MIAPNTNIYLLKTPMELNDNNTLSFTSETAKYNYFTSLPKLLLEDATYVRKDGVLRYPTSDVTYEDLLLYNYCMYQNENYDNKWFYAYIDDIKYANDGMSEITLRTDCFMTWQNEIIYKTSFIEREHVSDDTIGLHTLPEDVEMGEYIINSSERDTELDTFSYIIQVTEYTNGDVPVSVNFGGVASAGGAYICSSMLEVATIIQAYQNGREDAVFNVYIAPSKIINNTSGTYQYSGQNAPVTYTKTITKQTTIDGYTPKNNKVLCYPYNFLVLDNNNGTSNILQYENFSSANCEFEIKGVPTVGGSIKCLPKNYKGELYAEQEGIMCGKFPTCSWVNDTYTNWLTQNAVNIGVGIASSGLNMIGAVATNNPMNYANSVLGIVQSVGQIYEHSIIPNSAQGNTNGGDINVCSLKNSFYFLKKSIKKEYAKIIDDFFTMYGYKVNAVETININKRTYYDYIKTIGCNIVGNIPQKDLEEIRKMFDNGLTIWHNPSYFLDYSVNNTIVS